MCAHNNNYRQSASRYIYCAKRVAHLIKPKWNTSSIYSLLYLEEDYCK